MSDLLEKLKQSRLVEAKEKIDRTYKHHGLDAHHINRAFEYALRSVRPDNIKRKLQNSLGEREIKTIYELAQNEKRLEEFGLSITPFGDKGQEQFSVDFARATSAQAASLIVAEQLSYSVQCERKRLFGDSEPPFSTQEAAITWIRETAANEPDHKIIEVIANSDTARALFGYSPSFTSDEFHIGDPVTLNSPVLINAVGLRGCKQKLIGFLDKHGHEAYLPISPQGMLAILADEAESISSITGWKKEEAVMHILTGVVPILPPVTASVHETVFLTESSGRPYKYLTVNFFGFDLTRDELIRLHAILRDLAGVKFNKGKVNERYELVEFVRQEAVVADNAEVFWSTLAERWSKRKGKDVVKPESFQRSYIRACDSLGVTPIRFRRTKSK
ncbi:MAG TPA: hypothetical protein VGK02_01545 [Candidatus Aquicultor sp.]|jgi:hypothetical protein